MGAGIPRGRFIEVLGDPATAKSAFGYAAIAAFQKAGGQAILLDSEAKTDRAFVERFGVDFDALGYSRGKTLAECVRLIGRVAETAVPKTPVIIVWDSIAATPGAEELEEATSEEGMPSEKARRARYLSGALRAVLAELTRRRVTLVAINQLRTTFNFRTGYSGTDSTGGKAVKYHSALRLHLRSRGKIRDREKDIVTGIQIEAEAIKNTCAPPFRKATLSFLFDSGFKTYSGLDELLLRHGRLKSAGGWLSYGDKRFRSKELDQVAAELPELLAPLAGTSEDGKV